ncbi:MAG: hypothetical protein MUE68_10350 [Bacteroidetes bacterium]|jgi:hypothetical protein|nr:hypothetical protein [Bacteroidota bacterium]
MALHRTVALYLLIFLTAWTGCAEDPTTVGLGVLPSGDLPIFFVDTLEAQAGATSRAIPVTARADDDVVPWYPQHLFVGGVQTLVAGSFIRFQQFPDTLTGITIEAADLLLVRTVATGDTTISPVFTMHQPLRPWYSDSLSYDSLRLQPGVYFDPVPLPPGLGTGSVDTVSRSVAIPLDTALVRRWFTTVVDTGTTNLGVFLRGSANGLIQGYGSFIHLGSGAKPRLRVRYNKNGVTSTTVFSAGTARYLADLPSADLVLDPSKIYVQSGVAYRGLVTFNLSGLPRPVSVSNAVLEVTLDSLASNIYAPPDSLLAFFVDRDGSILKGSAVACDLLRLNGRPVYWFRLPAFAQQWMASGTPATVALAGYTENASFNRFVLFGPGASTGVRPRLIVTYSKAIATYGGRR